MYDICRSTRQGSSWLGCHSRHLGFPMSFQPLERRGVCQAHNGNGYIYNIHIWLWINTYKNTIFNGMNIHFNPAMTWGSLGTRVLTHCHICIYICIKGIEWNWIYVVILYYYDLLCRSMFVDILGKMLIIQWSCWLAGGVCSRVNVAFSQLAEIRTRNHGAQRALAVCLSTVYPELGWLTKGHLPDDCIVITPDGAYS